MESCQWVCRIYSRKQPSFQQTFEDFDGLRWRQESQHEAETAAEADSDAEVVEPPSPESPEPGTDAILF